MILCDVNVLFLPAAKYREEFKLIIDRIAVVKSENVSKKKLQLFLTFKGGKLFSQLLSLTHPKASHFAAFKLRHAARGMKVSTFTLTACFKLMSSKLS